MPSISGSLDQQQPLVHVLISGLLGDGGNFAGEQFVGLIDTGATRTCITRTVVERLGLRAFSKMLVATPTGFARRKAYTFSLGFFEEGDGSVGAVRSPYFFPDPVTGADFVSNSSFDVLIGMDILSSGRFVLDRQRFHFEFGN